MTVGGAVCSLGCKHPRPFCEEAILSLLLGAERTPQSTDLLRHGGFVGRVSGGFVLHGCLHLRHLSAYETLHLKHLQNR